MSKELGGFSDQTLSHWFPMEGVPCSCKQENQTMQELWEGPGPTKRRCDMARGLKL
jgi:hypothetical protein